MPKLREAKILVPLRDNHGASLEHVHASVTERLFAAFGGVTWTVVDGAWKDPNDGQLYVERSVAFTVAVPEDEGAIGNDDCDLCRIARFAMIAGEQKAIYVQFPDGEVQILQAERVLPDDSHYDRSIESAAN